MLLYVNDVLCANLFFNDTSHVSSPEILYSFKGINQVSYLNEFGIHILNNNEINLLPSDFINFKQINVKISPIIQNFKINIVNDISVVDGFPIHFNSDAIGDIEIISESSIFNNKN